MRRKLLIGAGLLAAVIVAIPAVVGRETASATMQKAFSAAVSETRDVNVRRDIAYGPHARHKLNIFEPAQNADASPIVIFLYGGGWKRGHRGIYGFVGAALASRGITAVIPDYRVYPEVKFPGFVDDAARVYGWLWKEYLNGEPTKRPIILAGHSAGAHMAALVALDPGYLDKAAAGAPRPAGLISLAGPLAFDPTEWPTTKAIFSGVANSDATRPVKFARQGAPRALLMHGLNDRIVRLWNMREMGKALKAAGNQVRSIEYPDVGHIGLVTAIARPLRWRAPVLQDMVDFINGLKT